MNRKLGQSNSVAVALFAALTLGLAVPIPVYAQVTGATLAGAITDSSGAVIPNAKVSIKNTATGVVTNGTTNTAGFYTVPNLLPGPYEVTTSAMGFQTNFHSGITLTVGAEQLLNVALRIGQALETVSVTGAAPGVQLASSSMTTEVNETTVRDLPLNGRDWTLLAALEPGTSALVNQRPTAAVTGSRSNRGNGQQLTISGTRPQLNNYRIDGISVVDYAGGSPGGVQGSALGVDAIQEFSVITANQSAEYGRTAGGVVNAVTKSGTDQFHGDAYEFLRNSALDARNFFDVKIPPFRRNQFGASVGGPIQKGKMFFFADYEGVRQSLGATNVYNVPSAEARNGIIHNADGTTTTVTVDPLVKPFLGLWPLPNAGLTGLGNTGLFDIATNTVTRENFVTARIDGTISDKDSISGTWYYDPANIRAPGALDAVLLFDSSSRQMMTVEETHIFSPSLVNSVRVGYNRVVVIPNLSLNAINPLAADPSLGTFAGRDAPTISVSGLTTFGGGVGVVSTRHYWNSFQGYDDGFLTKGKHSLKFGVAVEHIQHNQKNYTSANGKFAFGSLSSFLTDAPKNFTGTPPGFGVEVGARQTLIGGYLQDDWRLRPNLTLNLGLRYEMVTVPTEVHNHFSNFRTIFADAPSLGSPYFNNPTLRNFEPRIGFSWDPFHNGKTAVRGGFGIFDALPLNYEFMDPESGSFPYTVIFTAANLAPGSFPTGVVGPLLASPPTSSDSQNASIQFNPPRNYVMIWNLNVQRQLTPSTTLMVGYVGNHGVHMLFRADDANVVLPTATPQGYLWPYPAGSGNVLNPSAGDLRLVNFGADSKYDALEVQVTKRMSHSFQVQGSFTWAKNIDDGSSSILGDTFVNSISSLLWFCNSCRTGLSDYNIGKNLTVNYLWDVPTPNNWGRLGSHVLGGWELGGIITAESGIPITPLIGGDPLGVNSTDPFAYPNRLTGPGCSSLVNPGNPYNYIKLNCFAVPMATPAIAARCTPFSTVPGSCANLLGDAGRNVVVGPGLVDFDLSLMKNIPLRENFRLQFRAEFFNILNRANFAAPVNNSTLFDETGAPVGGAGSIDQTSTPSREIQFGLKLIW